MQLWVSVLHVYLAVNQVSCEIVHLNPTRNRHLSQQVRQILTSFHGLFFSACCYNFRVNVHICYFFAAAVFVKVNSAWLWLRICLVLCLHVVTTENFYWVIGEGQTNRREGGNERSDLKGQGRIMVRGECIIAIGH